MAQTMMTVTLEMDAINDAVSDIAYIRGALAKCHGVEFRRLDRRIENLIENTPSGVVDVHSIPACGLVASPSGEFTEILREARRLGLLR